MSEKAKDRKSILSGLLSKILNEKINDKRLDQIISLEDEMTENKDLLTVLNNRGIVSDQELMAKIPICFDVFLSRIVSLIDEEACRAIYDYIPGEKIDFLYEGDNNVVCKSAEKVREKVLHLKAATAAAAVVAAAAATAAAAVVAAAAAATVVGRGFSDIANEARTLSEKTNNYFGEIRKIIGEITGDTSKMLNNIYNEHGLVRTVLHEINDISEVDDKDLNLESLIAPIAPLSEAKTKMIFSIKQQSTPFKDALEKNKK